MKKSEAMQAVRDIAGAVIEDRGDLSTDGVRTWAEAYTHWREAAGCLTASEIDGCIFEARVRMIDDLADAHEAAMYESEGEAAFGLYGD